MGAFVEDLIASHDGFAKHHLAHLPLHFAGAPIQPVGLQDLRDVVVALQVACFVRARACDDDVDVVIFARDIDRLTAQGRDDDALAQLSDVIEDHLLVGGLVCV